MTLTDVSNGALVSNLRWLARDFHCYGVYGIRKDCKKVILTSCKFYQSLYIVVVAQYFEVNWNCIMATMATLEFNKKKHFKKL